MSLCCFHLIFISSITCLIKVDYILFENNLNLFYLILIAWLPSKHQEYASLTPHIIIILNNFDPLCFPLNDFEVPLSIFIKMYAKGTSFVDHAPNFHIHCEISLRLKMPKITS